MIMDKRAQFLEATALNTGAAGTYLVGDVYDTGLVNQDIGNGDDLFLVMIVTTAILSGGAATVQFQFVSDAQAAIAVDTTATLHFQTAAIPKATLIVGYRICVVQIPWGTYERYLGILQITGVAALTAGAVTAFLTKEPAKWAAIADGVN